MSASWQSIAAQKQEERRARIPHEWTLGPRFAGARGDIVEIPRLCGVLSHDELTLTEQYDATSLLTELAHGRLQSEDVVRAFSKRAAVAQQLTNCLTEILFDEALVRARELDAKFRSTGKPTGPLHGLPISLKDSFQIVGYDASLGVASLCFKPATRNAALVDLLLDAGAVLYCKTNVPQTLASLDSHNNVFGRTLNPNNTSLTAGGSTGGEGALLALRGSILGVGTDVGGSIRVPAFCNGLYGVKPSHGRVPYAGQAGGGSAPGSSKIGVEPTAGPISTTLRDSKLFLTVISNSAAERYDPDIVGSQKWAQQVSISSPQAPLRIGMIRTDGHVQTLPPIQTLMDQVAATLRSARHRPIEVVELDVTNILRQTVKVFNGFMSIDGANTWLDLLDATGEPLSPWLQGRLARRARKTTPDVVKLHAAKLELQKEFLKVWTAKGGYWSSHPDTNSTSTQDPPTLDAIVMPPAPHPVAPIDGWNTVNYTAALNLLDLPTGVLPVRSFTEEDLVGEVPAGAPLNGWDKVNRELWTKVDRKVYLGSSLSVQVFTPRLMERKLVEVMAVLDEALRPLYTGEGSRASKL